MSFVHALTKSLALEFAADKIRLPTGPDHSLKVGVVARGWRLTCRSGKWPTKRVGLAGGMGRAKWSGVAVLSSSDYLDGVLGRFSLPVPCASKSIRFKALS